MGVRIARDDAPGLVLPRTGDHQHGEVVAFLVSAVGVGAALSPVKKEFDDEDRRVALDVELPGSEDADVVRGVEEEFHRRVDGLVEGQDVVERRRRFAQHWQREVAGEGEAEQLRVRCRVTIPIGIPLEGAVDGRSVEGLKLAVGEPLVDADPYTIEKCRGEHRENCPPPRRARTTRRRGTDMGWSDMSIPRT